LARGVYLHPTHTMFLSTAHTAADIDEALAATDEAMAVVARL
jgi:glutamate-1-semialdehyde 2,1-aminomutase